MEGYTTSHKTPIYDPVEVSPESTEFTKVRERVDAQFRQLEHIQKLSLEITDSLTGAGTPVFNLEGSQSKDSSFLSVINSRLDDHDTFLNGITITLEHLKSKI